jgi:hypothetical protein
MKRLVVMLAAAGLFLSSCGPQRPSFGKSWTPSPGTSAREIR